MSLLELYCPSAGQGYLNSGAKGWDSRASRWERAESRIPMSVGTSKNNKTFCNILYYVTAKWSWIVGGTVASWLVRSTPEWAVRVWALAGDIVLCSWARHFTLTVPLSTQVYKWVPANCRGNLTDCGEVTCDGLASHPGGSRNTPSRFMLQKPG